MGCTAARQARFESAAVSAYTGLSNGWGEWANRPHSYDGYPLQRALQAAQQLQVAMLSSSDDACAPAHRLALAAVAPLAEPASRALVLNAHLRDPRYNNGANQADWTRTLAELVGNLKVVHSAANRFAAALGLPPFASPIDGIWDRY
jgi:hypothetical protein